MLYVLITKLSYIIYRQLGRNGKKPAAESYCSEAAKTPLYAANLREDAKTLKYF